MNIKEVVEIVENQPRLEEFVKHLYTNQEYRLDKLKSLDSQNAQIAFHIIYKIYPENPFQKSWFK
tara:strand:- start:637 stop:831 length:195 start_codon:yes stop_codon:yes gene_type:complete